MAISRWWRFAVLAAVGVGVLTAVLLTGGPATAQPNKGGEKPPAKADETKEPEDDSESLIDNMVRYAMPGKHHTLLARLVGHWDMEVSYRMTAQSPAVTSKGSCERSWILGRRFVQEEFDGGTLGLPFEGVALYGYDAYEEKYTSAWVDTTSTSITTSLGELDESGKVINFTGVHGDPWSGKKKPTRGVTRLVSTDKHVLELYEPGPEGKEYKVLEIVYTRKTTAEQ